MSVKDKVVALFKFIEGLNKIRQEVILQVSKHPWRRSISSFPDDPENIKVYYRDRVGEEDTENMSDVLLSVHKPEFQDCPDPGPKLAEWLIGEWRDYRREVKVRDSITRPLKQEPSPKGSDPETDGNATYTENFTDSKERVARYDAWQEKRAIWIKRQEVLARTRNLFSELYGVCTDLERESETLELVIANGFLLDRDNPELEHPILTRRVRIQHDAVANTICVKDADVETEMYTEMFQDMEGITLSTINSMREKLHQGDYHPLDRVDLPEFLKEFIHQLSAESRYSDDGIPDGWRKRDRFLLYPNPCYILRKRMDGALRAIEQIVEHVEKTGEVAAPLADIVDGRKIRIAENTGELSIEEQLAAVGGESVDILLSKEANKEQLEIARRIKRHNAVLVQGPPGTGKTHTIANLMGHFLAQGKSVLVTSHTSKALSVLKEKIAPGLQNLCVSMLDDSHADMEKSVDGITDRMTKENSFSLKKDMESLARDRKQIIHALAETRKQVFACINKEYASIVYNGEAISPSDAAKFVQQNNETLSYIPGTVSLGEPLPLNAAELTELYQSNGDITSADESEFERDIPDPDVLLSPDAFETHLNSLHSATHRLNALSEETHWELQNMLSEKKILIEAPFGKQTLAYPDVNAVTQLRDYISTFPKAEPWMRQCAVDGKRGASHENKWQELIRQLEKTSAHAEKLISAKFGREIRISSETSDFRDAMEQLRKEYKENGSVGRLRLFFHKQLGIALKGATIDGQQPQNAADCQLILEVMELHTLRDQCASYWDELFLRHGVPKFYSLQDSDPEQVATNYIPLIQRYLGWFKNEYPMLTACLRTVGLDGEEIFEHDFRDSDLASMEKILTALSDTIPKLCDIFEAVQKIADAQETLKDNRRKLQAGRRISSPLCRALLSAMDGDNPQAYRSAFAILGETYAKAALRNRRERYLNRLTQVAPQWADAIRARDGLHGETTLPSNIGDAWKWKQYSGELEKITATPFAELQKESLELSKTYRRITAKYAETSAWYHLLCTAEQDSEMQQALVGWKLTVKRIGKGAGKSAPMYRAEARKLMVKCQKAVPGWIMPIGKALESLNPGTNKFDVIIIDEASQSNLSSLAILYMGRKMIIVGDDKQVSPMAVGDNTAAIKNLRDTYITDIIPNSHLYDTKTSIYDVAETTFQSLMLREHFRCVPEIITFSNWLSYKMKIKPLRDCNSSILLPAVVNYRVKNGKRVGDANPNEARAIIALMRACMEQPEYAGKTFGVISLLGGAQVTELQHEINSHISPKTIKERRILCGTAPNFQGDERDVVFLSLVDSATGDGPLAYKTEGQDEANKKRYNVAASRARDQLWVVDSLDSANDLKPGDIRKKLIDYSLNPDSVIIANAKIKDTAESPFEAAVACALTTEGYHLVQQWKVGAYRLDMVVICGKEKVAIECDGESYHSGEEKIREDMERQTILERLGWRFIRIRGSEYYRDPDKAMERVVSELKDYGIEPEETPKTQTQEGRETDLLRRVKQRAQEFLHQGEAEDDGVDVDTISAALGAEDESIGDSADTAGIPTPTKAQAPGTNIVGTKPTDSMEKPKDKKQAPRGKNSGSKGKPAAKAPKGKEPTSEAKAVGTVLTPLPTQDCIFDSRAPESEQMALPGMEDHKPVQMSLPGLSNHKTHTGDIIELLKATKAPYVDKRAEKGSLWLIGGEELAGIVERAKALGYIFRFKKEGGRATKNKPGWWTK